MKSQSITTMHYHVLIIVNALINSVFIYNNTLLNGRGDDDHAASIISFEKKKKIRSVLYEVGLSKNQVLLLT